MIQLLFYQEYHRVLFWDPCMLFLCYIINDLPRSKKSKVRMYADDTLAGPCWVLALSGPTAMRPNRSTAAMEPPPAPISTISITGMWSGRPLPLRKRWAWVTSKARVVYQADDRLDRRQLACAVAAEQRHMHPTSKRSIQFHWKSGQMCGKCNSTLQNVNS